MYKTMRHAAVYITMCMSRRAVVSVAFVDSEIHICEIELMVLSGVSDPYF